MQFQKKSIWCFSGDTEKRFVIDVVSEAEVSMEMIYAIIIAFIFICVVFITTKCYCKRQSKPSKSWENKEYTFFLH